MEEIEYLDNEGPAFFLHDSRGVYFCEEETREVDFLSIEIVREVESSVSCDKDARTFSHLFAVVMDVVDTIQVSATVFAPAQFDDFVILYFPVRYSSISSDKTNTVYVAYCDMFFVGDVCQRLHEPSRSFAQTSDGQSCRFFRERFQEIRVVYDFDEFEERSADRNEVGDAFVVQGEDEFVFVSIFFSDIPFFLIVYFIFGSHHGIGHQLIFFEKFK